MISRNRLNGTSMGEYGLILAVLAVGGIMAYQVFGLQVEHLYKSTADSLTVATRLPDYAAVRRAHGNEVVGDTPATQPSSPTYAQPSARTVPPELASIISKYEKLCFNNHSCVDVPVTRSGPQTLGANGGELIRDYTRVLNQLADALASDPTADQTMTQKIRDLADKGHLVAEIDDGQIASVRQDLTASGSTWMYADNFKASYQELKTYADAHPNALPPAVADLIALEHTQIVNLHDGFADHQDALSQHTINIYPDRDPYAELVVQLIHMDSNTICGTGRDHGCMH